MVVVIDGLEEATDEQGKNKIAELIGKELNSLPEWIGFVVTSRPEAQVISHLGGFKPFDISANDPRNQADLRNWYREYLGEREELQGLSSAEQRRIEDLLIQRSTGMILFLKVIEEGFQEGSLTVDGLVDLSSGLPGLNRRYFDSFQQLFGSDYDNAIKPFLRVLLAAGGPLPTDLACQALKWNSERLHTRLARLGSYVTETIDGYELFHETLSEWLRDKSSGAFHVDQTLGRQELADVLFDEIKNRESHLVRWRPEIQEWLPTWLPQLTQYNDSSPLRSLSDALRNWTELSTARPILERSLAVLEKFDNSENPDKGPCLTSLALLLNDQGDYADAEPLFRQALEIYEKAYGSDHTYTAIAISNLAFLLCNKHDFAGAEQLYRRAVSINERSLGSDHISTVLTLDGLAWALHNQGNYTGAEPLYRRALEIREKELGPDHPDVAMTLNNLGQILQAKGDCKEAAAMYFRALEVREKTLGMEHPYTATTISYIASLLAIQGDHYWAENLYRRAVAIYEMSLGTDHPNTALILGSFAEFLREKGDIAEAEPLQRRTLAIIEKSLGSENPLAATSINNLGLLLQATRDYEGAEKLYRRALSISEKILGPDHPNTATILRNLNGALNNLANGNK